MANYKPSFTQEIIYDKQDLEELITSKNNIIAELETKRVTLLAEYNELTTRISREQYTMDLLVKQLRKLVADEHKIRFTGKLDYIDD